MALSFMEKASIYLLFKTLKDNPKELAREYKKNPERWEKLKMEYPNWKDYLEEYADLAEALRKEGVPL